MGPAWGSLTPWEGDSLSGAQRGPPATALIHPWEQFQCQLHSHSWASTPSCCPARSSQNFPLNYPGSKGSLAGDHHPPLPRNSRASSQQPQQGQAKQWVRAGFALSSQQDQPQGEDQSKPGKPLLRSNRWVKKVRCKEENLCVCFF